MLGEELPTAQYMGGGAGVEVVVAQSYYDTDECSSNTMFSVVAKPTTHYLVGDSHKQ